MIVKKTARVELVYRCDYCKNAAIITTKDLYTEQLPDNWAKRKGRWVGPGYDYETLHLCPACLAKHDAPKTLARIGEDALRIDPITIHYPIRADDI